MPHSVLIIDDEEAIAWALRRAFEKAGHPVAVAATAEDGLKKAAAQNPGVIFLDVRLPGMDGLTALEKLRAASPTAAVIVMTAHGNLATAVKAVAGGAFDYLAKPFDLHQALDAAARATATAATANGPRPTPITAANEILGRTPAIQSVFKRIALVAPTEACVLVTGESGTGKELVARAIHANSPRRDKPFLPVHVAALNPNLVESELFGHVRGSFTGADRNRDGLLALASGGTVFLDEIADIPLPVQAKLLRVLERQEVLPVGGAAAQPVNVRIVSATHVDLAAAVADGRFRHDLFFRLNVYPIHVPALRDRADDIPVLAEAFLHRFAPTATLTAEAIDVLKKRVWPGNVRELRNAVEHAAIEGRGGPVRPEHLPDATAHVGPQSVREQLSRLVRAWVAERVTAVGGNEPAELYQGLLDEVEPALVGEVLRQLDGNRLAAGRWLGLARATVRKLIRKYGLAPDAEGDETGD
jgi:two-component system, NtrC family, nitrogen regulation response regulator GlnG